MIIIFISATSHAWLPIYISVARPAKHEDEQSDQVDSTFAFGKYSSFYKIYVVFCTRIQLTIDRLDHSGHLIRKTLVEKIIILRGPFVSCKTKVYGYDADTSLNIYLKSYAGTVELHVQIMYKRIG